MELCQSIGLKSVKNARELGTYRTEDGKTIKKGRLLRTGKLSKISNEDLNILTEKYNLGYIIDFRMPVESQSDRDPQINGIYCRNFDIFDYDLFENGDKMQKELDETDPAVILPLIISTGALNDDAYIKYADNDKAKKAFGEFFKTLKDADDNRSVLWHCTSGKDRTGIASMLVLTVLGADEKTILEDYLLTNEYNKKEIEMTAMYFRSRGFDDNMCEKAVLAFSGVNETFMINLMDHLKMKYGSIKGYIHSDLGVNNDDINIIRKKYLE